MPRYRFTYDQEIGHQGQSLVPHYPGGASGVTIGPGYDMKFRSPEQIYEDLTRAGVDPETAYALTEAAHLSGSEAQEWINKTGGIYLTEEQQQQLFVNILVPEYEDRLRQQLTHFASAQGMDPSETAWETLSETQKEILFDYVYNTGSITRFPELTRAVITEDWSTAALHYERFSDGQPLAYRNEMFFREFLDPDYQRPVDNWDWPREEESLAESLNNEFNELYTANETDEPLDSDQASNDDWYEST